MAGRHETCIYCGSEKLTRSAFAGVERQAVVAKKAKKSLPRACRKKLS